MKRSLRSNDGRYVCSLDLKSYTVFKRVRASTHMLRIPPCWTYDDRIILDMKRYVKYGLSRVEFVIQTTDTDKTYRISYADFERYAYPMKWRQDPNYKQWAVPLKHWRVDGGEPEEQLKLF